MTQTKSKRSGEFTGWHMLAVCVGAFGVIITVNLALAFNAVRTFPGLNVKNSYVASQEFDVRRAAQEALGWRVDVVAERDTLRVNITGQSGQPVEVESLTATVGRATHLKDDMTPEFQFDGAGYVAPAVLAPGKWAVRLDALAEDGTRFEQRIVLHVRG